VISCDFGLFFKITILNNFLTLFTIKVIKSRDTKVQAPEISFGGSYDYRVDVYSLAIISMELFDMRSKSKYFKNKMTLLIAYNLIISFSHRSNQANNFDIYLEAQYTNLKDQVKCMFTSPFWRERPSCAQVLEKLK